MSAQNPLVSALFTTKQARQMVDERLGEPVPPQTFHRWKRSLGLTPRPNTYDLEDVVAIAAFGSYQRNGFYVSQAKQLTFEKIREWRSTQNGN